MARPKTKKKGDANIFLRGLSNDTFSKFNALKGRKTQAECFEVIINEYIAFKNLIKEEEVNNGV